jgi:hypothetical protein
MMHSSRLWRVSLEIAGVYDCALALYHTVLPFHMGWKRFLDGVPDSIVWALFALNFSWSVLLFLIGCLVIYAAKLGPSAGPFAKRMVFVVGLFWLIHGIYTWVSPLPLPKSLTWLKYTLGVFPAVVIVLHWLPLCLYRGSPLREFARR